MDKNEFQQNAKKKIDSLFTRLDEIKAKKDTANDKTRSQIDNKISELNAVKNELKEKYGSLKNAPDDKWEEVKGTFSSAFTSFKEGLTKLSSLYK